MPLAHFPALLVSFALPQICALETTDSRGSRCCCPVGFGVTLIFGLELVLLHLLSCSAHGNGFGLLAAIHWDLTLSRLLSLRRQGSDEGLELVGNLVGDIKGSSTLSERVDGLLNFRSPETSQDVCSLCQKSACAILVWYGVFGGGGKLVGGRLDVSNTSGMSTSFSSATGVNDGEGDNTTEGIRVCPDRVCLVCSGTRVMESGSAVVVIAGVAVPDALGEEVTGAS